MKLLTPEINQGTIAAAGHFQPFFEPGLPAIFTAGIVTDVGELTVQVSAQELSFQTDGPIICQALFQRLAPRAPQYGAQINYAGDRLEVYFDPAYTVTQGGIIFARSRPPFSLMSHPSTTTATVSSTQRTMLPCGRASATRILRIPIEIGTRTLGNRLASARLPVSRFLNQQRLGC
jgi:hypothetical protein